MSGFWLTQLVIVTLNILLVVLFVMANTDFCGSVFETQVDHVLLGHVMSKATVVDEFECQLKCLGNISCKSFNVHPGSNNANRICELNNKTRQMKPGDFKWKKGSAYYGSVQVSCMDVSRERTGQTKSGQCHPGYKGKQCQTRAGYALLFPRKGTSDYVITRGMRSLTAVTVCFWMKTTDTGNEGVSLSYNAVSGSDVNELTLFDYRDFYLYVGGSDSRRTSVSANDGNWHHICATWENTAGSWNLFKDGKVAASGKGLKTGHVIRGGGALVLGQEQDSVGGSFNAGQCFIGEMTGVNIWDHVITDQEIMHMSQSCLTGVGNVFQWRDFKGHVTGSVIIHPSC